MSWLNQGGFPTGGGSGGTSVVNTTINNFEGSEIVEYATFAAMQTAFPIVDTIGVISASSGDGYEGQAYYYNTSAPGWVSAEAPITVNGIAGPVISLDASNIAPTASRIWFTPAEQATLLTASTDAALLGSRVGAAETDIDALQTSQTTQDGRLTAAELATTTNTNDIAALTTNLGGRLTIAEADIVALENSQSAESGRLNALEAGQSTQDTRLTGVEGVNSSQGVQIAALQLSDATLASRVTAVEISDDTQGVQLSGIDGRLTTAESDINALESGQAIQDVATSAVNARVTVTETDIDNLQTTQSGFQSTIDLLPGVYQARSEKNIPGGYVGLRPNGTIDPLQLPPSVQGVREISYEPTIAARDALAAFDTRPEVNGPWGVAQAGFAVSVADKGDGSAGFYVWNGTGFDDYSNSFTLTNSDDVPEGSANLYYTNARVAAAPAVTANTGAIATINAGQTTQDGRILALETSQSTQDGRLTATELATTTNAGDIAAIEAEQSTQNGRLTTAESDITTNTNAIAANAVDIAALEANDVVQDAAIAARLISFNGRTAPAVVPTAGDYDNSQITNVASLATGATTAAALDNLKTEINGIDANIASIDDKVTNGGDAGVISIGTTDAASVSLFANNVTKITLDHNDGLIKLPGLTEDALGTGAITVNPANGALYIDPNMRIPTGHISGCTITFPATTSITVASGQLEIGGGLINFPSPMTKNAALAWGTGTAAGGQIGTWGNGSQYVYVGHNPTTSAVDVFVSNTSNLTTSGGFNLKLLAPLYVEAAAFKPGMHWPEERRFMYDVDWSTPINPVTTTGGGLITVGVPVYPLAMDISCSSGYPLAATIAAALRFSRNSANPTPAITVPQSWISGYDGDTSAYFSSSGYIFVGCDLTLVTHTGQIRALRVNSFLNTNTYPTFKVRGYSWSK
jgi:uncharacterized coiled-coil protein SlyX